MSLLEIRNVSLVSIKIQYYVGLNWCMTYIDSLILVSIENVQITMIITSYLIDEGPLMITL